MKRGIVVVVIMALFVTTPSIGRGSDDSWGWPLIAGAIVGGGVLIGSALHEVGKKASSSWNYSYITAVSDRMHRLSAQYNVSVKPFYLDSDKKSIARILSEQHPSVSRFLSDLDSDVSDFDSAISGLQSKLTEWGTSDDRRDMYRDGADVLRRSLSVQSQFHELNNRLQSQRAYYVLYDVVRCKSPELSRYGSYPYHDLLGELEQAKNVLQKALNGLECQYGLDSFDRQLCERARFKLEKLSDSYTHVIESAQYHHEKLEKLREQRHRELMIAQERLREAEEACAELVRAKAERERAHAEWCRQQDDLHRLKRELRELEGREYLESHPSFEYVSIQVDL